MTSVVARGRSPWTWVLGSLVILSLLAAFEGGLLSRGAAQWTSDLLQLSLATGAGIGSLRAARRTGSLAKAFWALIGLGAFTWAAGQALWTLRTAAFLPQPAAGAADLLFVASTTPFLAASVLRPHRSRPSLARLAIDLGLLTVLALYVFSYFALAHLLAGAVSAYARWSTALFDLRGLAVFPVLLWLLRGSRPPWRRVYHELAVALIVLHIGNAVSNPALVDSRYHPGFYDLPWTLPFFWIGLSALGFRPEAIAAAAPPADGLEWLRARRSSVVALLALVLVPAFHMTATLAAEGDPVLLRWRSLLTLLATLLLGGLLLLRQLSVIREAERTLRVREERFRALVEKSADVVTIIDAEAVNRYQSPSMARVLGYSPAERLGRSGLELVHPEDLPLARATFARCLGSPGQRQRVALRVRHRDGSWRDAEVDAVNRLGEPAVRGVVVNFRDLTERRRAEEERERSLSLLGATLESTADGILVVDREGRIASFNQKFVRMWGIPEEVMASEDHERALDFVVEQLLDPEGFLSRVRAIYARAESESFDTLHFKDGRVFERYSQQQRLGEKVVGRVWSFRDVTERTRAEEAMSRLVAILEATTDFVGMAGLDGRVLYLNRAGRRMVGRGEEEDLSDTRIAEYHPAWAARIVLEEAVPTAMGAGVWSGETALLDGEGREIPVLQLVLAHRSGGGGVEYLSTIARDISQRKQAEEALRRSQTMAALGSLVAGVAHEVRNPLFGISSTLDAFEARFGRGEGQGEYVAVLREQLERLNALMNDLLEYGKPARLELEEGSMEEVIAEAVRTCAALAERAGVELLNRARGGLPPVRMERARMAQVFRNLIENAVQHSPRGGAVRVAVGVERARRDGGSWVACTVEDSGPGIAPEDLPRLFEPFFTRRRGGTGLGLSIAHRIVEEHGGTLTAANRPTGGARVTVALPGVAEPPSLAP